MNKEAKLALIIVAMIAVAGISGYALSKTLVKPPEHFVPPEFNPELPPPNFDPADRDSFIHVKSALTLINMVLSAALIALYVKIYRETKAQFTLGLIYVMLALFLYALMSNPLLPVLFGYRVFGMGPFSMLPDLFTTVALSVLIYLTAK